MKTMNKIFDLYLPRINKKLKSFIPAAHPLYQDLIDATHYSVFNGGKRFRPLLVYLTGRLFDTPLHLLDIPACSAEYVHCFSLVHDDLPAMDNSDLRRGKATCHKVFGDDMAILAGDGLLTLAHSILADQNNAALSSRQRLKMIQVLSCASGLEGLAAGQAIDIRNLENLYTIDDLQKLHRLKTGELIIASVLLGAHCTIDPDPEILQILTDFADTLGLLYQVSDDIIDITSDTETLGKPQGIDHELGKATFPDMLGLNGAKDYAKELASKATEALSLFDEKADGLRTIVNFVLTRKH